VKPRVRYPKVLDPNLAIQHELRTLDKLFSLGMPAPGRAPDHAAQAVIGGLGFSSLDMGSSQVEQRLDGCWITLQSGATLSLGLFHIAQAAQGVGILDPYRCVVGLVGYLFGVHLEPIQRMHGCSIRPGEADRLDRIVGVWPVHDFCAFSSRSNK
jgi:hypothetical protein